MDSMVFSPEDIRHLVAKSGPTQVVRNGHSDLQLARRDRQHPEGRDSRRSEGDDSRRQPDQTAETLTLPGRTLNVPAGVRCSSRRLSIT